MSKEEFIKRCVRQGYCLAGYAEKYTKRYPKDEYTEEDMISAYRMESGIRTREAMFLDRMGYPVESIWM